MMPLPPEQCPLESSVALPGQAGDVVCFIYSTIHGSNVNVSQEARATLRVQMCDAADQPLEDGNEEPGAGLMLRGILPVDARAGIT